MESLTNFLVPSFYQSACSRQRGQQILREEALQDSRTLSARGSRYKFLGARWRDGDADWLLI